MHARTIPPDAPPWRPSAFLLGSMLLHGLALVALVADPAALWEWSLGLVAINQTAIGIACVSPRSGLLGPVVSRLPPGSVQRREVAITIDDGPDPEVTPHLLEILARHGAVATFFCIGRKAIEHPELVQAILRAGHAIENHGQNHRFWMAFTGPASWRREVQDGQSTITAATGRPPRFFRALAGIRNPFTDPVLHAAGLRLVSWSRRGYDTQDGDAAAVLARLSRDLGAGDVLLLHDGNCARTRGGAPVVLEVLPRLLDRFEALGLRTVTLDQAFHGR